MTMHKTGPLLMGLAMGPMMLWMAHDWIATGAGGEGLLLFVALHGLALLALLAGGAFLGRRLGLRRLLAGHGPRHMALMLAGAALSAGLVHLVHGGPV